MSNQGTKTKSANVQKESKKPTAHNQSGNQYKKHIENESSKNYFMIPILIILCIIPFIVRMKIYNTNLSQYSWFAKDDKFIDFFLYYKHWAFVLVAAMMIILLVLKGRNKLEKLKLVPVFIPLVIYGIMALLSSAFSEYPQFSFLGSFEQFESVFAILGYCIAAYYAFIVIKEEEDLKKVLNYIIITAIIMSIFGIFQFIGQDLFRADVFKKLIVPLKYQGRYNLNFSFENNRVYFTLYNPNYVGAYVAMITPIILVMLFFQRNVKKIILSIVAIIGLLIGEVGSQSLSGVIGLAAVLLFIAILMWRYLVKGYKITLSVGVVLIIGVIILNGMTNQLLSNKLINMFSNTKSEYALTSMDTRDDSIELSYNGHKLFVRNTVDDSDSKFTFTDENNQAVAANFDSTTNSILIADERFAGITVGVSNNYENAFFIQESGIQWMFTASGPDGTYYHINRFGRLDKMITSPSAVFTGHEWFATARGYLWSRTIPLLKNNLFLGSGPDTFVVEFPQQDYMNFQRYGYPTNIITKPHNLYLQIAVQDGLIALIAFLLFYAMYFISSIRLYIRGRFNNIYEQMGVAIFVGTIGYMVTGLANDSSITTAPTFWVLIGIGISLNYKVKSMIEQDRVNSKVS